MNLFSHMISFCQQNLNSQKFSGDHRARILTSHQSAGLIIYPTVNDELNGLYKQPISDHSLHTIPNVIQLPWGYSCIQLPSWHGQSRLDAEKKK